MYRTQIYSEDECIEEVSINEPGRHRDFIKSENRASYKRNAEEKRQQSEKAKARNEAKRTAEQASAYGQAPAKKGTVSLVARTSQRDTTSSGAASSSSHPQEPSQQARLVNGSDGTVGGTRRSFGTDASSGKRVR